MPSSLRLALGAFASLVLVAASARGHDFWLEPVPMRTTVGVEVVLQLWVGHGGDAEPYRRNPKHLRRFVVVTPNGEEIEPTGTDEETPAGRFTPSRPGLHVVGYRSHPTRIELEAERFEKYLREEGLDEIVAERRRRGEHRQPGRERFSRSCKSFVLVEGEREPADVSAAATVGFDHRLGLTVEFVPLDDPFSVRPGETIRLLVLEDGEPLADARVDRMRWDPEDKRPMGTDDARTDAAGIVRFQLPDAGRWLFTTTVMSRVEGSDDSGDIPAEERVDWESVWGSLVIDVSAE